MFSSFPNAAGSFVNMSPGSGHHDIEFFRRANAAAHLSKIRIVQLIHIGCSIVTIQKTSPVNPVAVEHDQAGLIVQTAQSQTAFSFVGCSGVIAGNISERAANIELAEVGRCIQPHRQLIDINIFRSGCT